MSGTDPSLWCRTDYLLAQLRWPASQAGDEVDLSALGRLAHELAARLPPADGMGMRADRLVWSDELRCAYLYFKLEHRALLTRAATLPLAEALRASLDGQVAVLVSRLEQVFESAGASAGQPCEAHYVVEMDPAPGSREEIELWYDQEHMPGLAAVPGCARAQRLLNVDHGPLSLACYDLARESAFGSPPWLAVRATAWSSRVRPNFTNTKRSMFRWVAI
jgi:hypothetical protein